MPRMLELLLADEAVAWHVHRDTAFDTLVRSTHDDGCAQHLHRLLALPPAAAILGGRMVRRINYLDFLSTVHHGCWPPVSILLARLDEDLHHPSIAELVLQSFPVVLVL